MIQKHITQAQSLKEFKMATFPQNAVASFKGAFTVEKIFAVLNALLQARKIMAGGYDPLNTEVVEGQAYTIISSNQAATLFGYGSQLHRMAIYHFLAAGGQIPVQMVPLPAASGGAAATSTITFATNATTAGTYVFRIGSYLTEDTISISVSIGDTPTAIAALLNTAISDNPNLPFSSTVLAGVLTVVAKTADVTSDDLLISYNLSQEETENAPGGMTVVIASTVSGVGSSDLTGLWDYISAESSPWNTSIVQPYDTVAAMDAAVVAIGNPNDQTGLYDSRDYRPASMYSVDRVLGEAGLVAALAVAEPRGNSDAANIRIEAPDYPELGYEIAAYCSGKIEVASMSEPASAYTRISLPHLYGPMNISNDWATYKAGGKAYDNRDLAAKAGITPLIFKDGVAMFGDVTGYWKPDDNQNAPFKFQVNRWKSWSLQNLYYIYINGTENKDRPIVNNSAATKQNTRAIDSDILTAGLALVTGAVAKNAWIYDAAFTIRNTQVIPSDINPDRFDFIIPVILSGNNRINLGEIQIDRDPSVVTLTIIQA